MVGVVFAFAKKKTMRWVYKKVKVIQKYIYLKTKSGSSKMHGWEDLVENRYIYNISLLYHILI